jgi:hypothetical protein
MLGAALQTIVFAPGELTPVGKKPVDSGWSLNIGASLDVGAWNLVLRLAF